MTLSAPLYWKAINGVLYLFRSAFICLLYWKSLDYVKIQLKKKCHFQSTSGMLPIRVTQSAKWWLFFDLAKCFACTCTGECLSISHWLCSSSSPAPQSNINSPPVHVGSYSEMVISHLSLITPYKSNRFTCYFVSKVIIYVTCYVEGWKQ